MIFVQVIFSIKSCCALLMPAFGLTQRVAFGASNPGKPWHSAQVEHRPVMGLLSCGGALWANLVMKWWDEGFGGWYCWWLKSCTSLSHYLQYRVSYIPGGVGFQPSTVPPTLIKGCDNDIHLQICFYSLWLLLANFLQDIFLKSTPPKNPQLLGKESTFFFWA